MESVQVQTESAGRMVFDERFAPTNLLIYVDQGIISFDQVVEYFSRFQQLGILDWKALHCLSTEQLLKYADISLSHLWIFVEECEKRMQEAHRLEVEEQSFEAAMNSTPRPANEFQVNTRISHNIVT